jgi:hypothetical protein
VLEPLAYYPALPQCSSAKVPPRHIQAGRVFVGSMLIMAVGAVYLGILKNQPSNIGGGITTFYLIGTGWLTARRKEGETSRMDWFALLIPLTLGLLTWVNGIEVLRSGATSQNGVPVGMSFFMGSISLLAAVGDVRMLLRGGVFGIKRIARHLWRMCFGCSSQQGHFSWDPRIAH